MIKYIKLQKRDKLMNNRLIKKKIKKYQKLCRNTKMKFNNINLLQMNYRKK